MQLKKDILLRVGIVYIGTFLFAILIIGKVIYIQFYEGPQWTERTNNITFRDIIISPNRGDIYDEEGWLLVSSVPYYELRMDMKSNGLSSEIFNKNVDSLAYYLSDLFRDKSKDEYKRELITARKKGKRYFLIKRKVNYLQLKECKKFPIFKLGRYKGGFIYNQTNRRVKPHNNLASRTMGYLSKGSSGNVVGIEGAYDHYLKGVEGVRLMQRLSGDVWMPIKDGNEIEPKDGKDLITTININIQDVAHHALYEQLVKHDANHGCAVLMEVSTGEIKAIVNLKKDQNGGYSELYNYAIGEIYEPGSTFKLISIIAALEDGLIDIDDTVDIGNGVTYFYGQRIADASKKVYGKISVKRAFEISSNVGISKTIYKCYKGRERAFIDRIYSMNLNEPLGLDIRGEGEPDIKYPGDDLWSGISLPMISLGYEVRLTPMQILTFYNAIANKGKMVKPKFVKELRYHSRVEKRFKTEVINPSICSMATIKKVHELLVGVVENGTAKNLRNAPFKIAGKTGTTEIYETDIGLYGNRHETSFVGYFPADNPQYSCIVVISSPAKNGHFGADVAAPVFNEIARKVYVSKFSTTNIIANNNNLNIPYTKNGSKLELDIVCNKLDIPIKGKDSNCDWVLTKKEEKSISYKQENIVKTLVPNVIEMGVKDAVFLLENTGLRVKIIGRGKVVKQSLPPGTRIIKGDIIVLYMSFT